MDRQRAYLIFLTLAALLAGCTRMPGTTSVSEEGIRVPFALSVGRAGAIGTKMSGEITQSAQDATFRGIEQVHIIPFHNGGTVISAGDSRWSPNLGLPQSDLPANTFADNPNAGLINTNNAHLYDQVFFRLETDAVLVYGKAPDEAVSQSTEGDVAFKRHNGVLLPSEDLDAVQTPEDLRFELEACIPDGSDIKNDYYNWRGNLLSLLKTITDLNVSRNGVTYTFNDPVSYHDHPQLTAALNHFTNGGIFFPLSAEVVSSRLTQLYREVYPYSQDYTLSEKYKDSKNYYYVYQLAKRVCETLANLSYTTNDVTVSGSGNKTTITLTKNGPQYTGLPAGTTVAQWQAEKKRFALLQDINSTQPATGNSSGLAIIPERTICFPPSLWYYANSPLRTSTDASVIDWYTNANSWSDIVSQYTLSRIFNSAEAVAVQEQVQYGVSLLRLVINKNDISSPLQDAAGTGIQVNNNYFPLTGIIIADQYAQAFDFTPEDGAAMQYVYDAELDGAYLSSNRTSTVQTSLVLPTKENAKVHFALEFKNNSSWDFAGMGGCTILKGSHFYLAGVLDPADAQSNPNGINRIFARDHVTTVNVKFNSLAAALPVVPDLSEPQLQLGVIAEFDWTLSTPVNVPIR